MGRLSLICWMVVCSLLAGCHYYQEYRQMKGDADIQEERAELMRAQRECAQKYEAEPAEVQRRCGVYKEMLQSLGGGNSNAP